MTNLEYAIKFDKFESEKLCNLLECSSDELDNIVSSAKESSSTESSLILILTIKNEYTTHLLFFCSITVNSSVSRDVEGTSYFSSSVLI